MSEAVSAAIAIQDDTLRYAELVRTEDGHALRRFGAESFAFDLARAILRREADVRQVHQVQEAIKGVLDGTEARELRVAVHPPDGYSFFTPISSDVPVRVRKRQLLQQAALVTGVGSTEKLYMTSETVRTTQDSEGDPFMWVHVLAVPDAVNERLGEMVQVLPVRTHTWMVTSETVCRVTGRVERTGGSAQEALRPYTLAVGQYPSHTEYALSRNREWYHSHYTQEAHSAENRAYFAVGFLNRVSVPLDAVGRLFVYGTNVDLEAYAPLKHIFGRDPEILNPFRVVENQTDHSADDSSAFAPCIGAAMDVYVT